MTVVVDASLALKWGLPEDDTEDAIALRDHWRDTGEYVVAPPIFRSEVTNAVRQNLRRGHLIRPDAAQVLGFLVSVVAISEPEGLYDRALALAGELGLGSTYDALYLALAELEGCEMWTADRRLARAVQPRSPRVRWLGDRS